MKQIFFLCFSILNLRMEPIFRINKHVKHKKDMIHGNLCDIYHSPKSSQRDILNMSLATSQCLRYI